MLLHLSVFLQVREHAEATKTYYDEGNNVEVREGTAVRQPCV